MALSYVHLDKINRWLSGVEAILLASTPLSQRLDLMILGRRLLLKTPLLFYKVCDMTH
jgi:hypothetical protein